MQTCRFISSVNSTFMGSFLLSPDDDIEEEALCLFESRRYEASQSAVFDIGFVALLELGENQIVVLIFEIEHLLIEMADRYIYIFTVLIERYRLF